MTNISDSVTLKEIKGYGEYPLSDLLVLKQQLLEFST
jgi:hypothetical protein